MKKAGLTQIIIIALAVSIMVPLFFMMGTSVTKYNQPIDQDNDEKSIVFELKKGQTVVGTLDFTGETNGAWFQIYDPNNNVPKKGGINYNGNKVNFTFTADTDGQYRIRVAVLDFSTQYINYSYSVSSQTIMNYDPHSSDQFSDCICGHSFCNELYFNQTKKGLEKRS